MSRGNGLMKYSDKNPSFQSDLHRKAVIYINYLTLLENSALVTWNGLVKTQRHPEDARQTGPQGFL